MSRIFNHLGQKNVTLIYKYFGGKIGHELDCNATKYCNLVALIDTVFNLTVLLKEWIADGYSILKMNILLYLF